MALSDYKTQKNWNGASDLDVLHEALYEGELETELSLWGFLKNALDEDDEFSMITLRLKFFLKELDKELDKGDEGAFFNYFLSEWSGYDEKTDQINNLYVGWTPLDPILRRQTIRELREDMQKMIEWIDK